MSEDKLCTEISEFF